MNKIKTTMVLAIIVLLASIVLLIFGVDFDVKITLNKQLDLMTLSTFFMAVFAGFTLVAAIISNAKQKRLLEEQKQIARKDFLLYKSDKLTELLNVIHGYHAKMIETQEKVLNMNWFDALGLVYELGSDIITIDAKTRVFYPDGVDILTLINIMANKIKEVETWDESLQKKTKCGDFMPTNSKLFGEMIKKIRAELVKIGQELKELEK